MEKPLLSFCTVVKNEEGNLKRCLESVRDVADEWIVVDTGSTDGTVEIARAFGARVLHFAWTGDFSAAKNFAIDQAKGEWILFLDGDEELVPEDRHRVRPLIYRSRMDGYHLSCINFVDDQAGGDAILHPQFRLCRNRPEYRYRGAIHEQLLVVVQEHGGAVEAAPIRFNHYGYLTRPTVDKNKIRRNVEIIRGELEKRPDDSFMRFNLGMEYMRLGEFERALGEYVHSFRTLDSLGSGYANMLLRNIGVCLLYLGRYQELYKVLDDALDAYPDFTDLQYLRAMGLFQEGRYTEASEAFSRCLSMGEAGSGYATQVGVGSFKAWIGLGQIYEHLGNVTNAVRAYTRALKGNDRYPPPVHCLGKLLLQHEPAEAVSGFFDQQLPDPPLAIIETLAGVFAGAREYGWAVRYIERALEKGAPSETLRVTRAECLMMQGRFSEAREAVAPLIKDEAWAGPALLTTGFCHLLEGNSPAARACWAEAAGSEGSQPEAEACSALAGVLAGGSPGVAGPRSEEEKGRFEKMIWMALTRLIERREFQQFERALPVLDTLPGSPGEKRVRLGKLYDALGFRESAFEELAAALEEGVYDHDGLVILAGMCAERGQWEDAEVLYTRCLGLNRRRVATYTSLARVLASQGKAEEARRIVEMGQEEFPGSDLLAAVGRTLRVAACQ